MGGLFGLVAQPMALAGAFVPAATKVAAGGSQSCTLLADTTAECWGSNSAGQLGDGTTVDRSAPTTVLDGTGTTPLTGIAQIAPASTPARFYRRERATAGVPTRTADSA